MKRALEDPRSSGTSNVGTVGRGWSASRDSAASLHFRFVLPPVPDVVGHGSALASSSGMSAQSFSRKVLLEAGRPSLDDAKRVTGAAFHPLRDRLTPVRAAQAAA